MDGVGLGATGGWARADFGAFVAGHCREVGLLALSLCGKRDVAEEIAADALAEAWRRWDELTRPGASPADAMGEIVQRLVHERADRADRADRAGRAGQPGRHSAAARDAEAEPDSVRVRALLAERLALIPSQDARTVVIARIVEPAEDATAKQGFGTKLRRPAPIAGAIVAVLLVAVGAVAMSGSNGGKSAQTNQPQIPPAPTGADALDAGSSASAAASTSTSASAHVSPSISASASARPSPSPSASPSVGAATSATAAASASPAAIAPSSPSLLTASASVYGQGHDSTWSQLDITASVKQTLSAFTLTITVSDCPGLSAAGAWNSGAGNQFHETTTTNRDGSVTYVFRLNPGDQVSPGTVDFAAQFSHQSSGWDPSADSYSIVAQAAGSSATNSLGGTF